VVTGLAARMKLPANRLGWINPDPSSPEPAVDHGDAITVIGLFQSTGPHSIPSGNANKRN